MPTVDLPSEARHSTTSSHCGKTKAGAARGNQDTLSEQVFLVNSASERVANRGPTGQPDLIENPGVRFDIVARKASNLATWNSS